MKMSRILQRCTQRKQTSYKKLKNRPKTCNKKQIHNARLDTQDKFISKFIKAYILAREIDIQMNSVNIRYM